MLPVLLMFLLGTLDFGRLMWTYTTLYRAVEAAARCGAVNATTCGTLASIQSYAVTQAWSLPTAGMSFVATTTATTPPCTQVVGTMTFTFVMPWFYGTAPYGAANAMPLTATACYPN